MARNTVAGRAGRARQSGRSARHRRSDGRQHVDFQTLQDHFGDATRSDLVIHDALRDRSSANFTGLDSHQQAGAPDRVQPGAEEHPALRSAPKPTRIPKLEILNNDVIRCTHGAAVGPVDPEMLFYLQSRGLDRDTRRTLIVEGFFQSVLESWQRRRLQDAVWSAIAVHEPTLA